MDRDEARRLMLKLLALAERMEQRDERVIALLAEQGGALRSAAHEVDAATARFVRDALRAQAREAVQAGVGEAIAQCRDRLLQAGTEAARSAETMHRGAEALQRQRSLWLWTAPLALLVGSAIAAGAAAYAVTSSRAEVERHRIEAALLRAYNRADVILCGERLCANIDERGARFGERGQYRPVEARTP